MHPLDQIKITRKAVDLYSGRTRGNHAYLFDCYRPSLLLGCAVEDGVRVLMFALARLARP
jgi:hypothetical protein